MYSRPAREVWDAALGELQLQVAPASFQTWLKNTTGVAAQDGEFIVGVPSTFVSAWLEKWLHPVIRQTVTKVVGRPVEVRFQVCANGLDRFLAPAASGAPKSNGCGVGREPGCRKGLNPRYTFASFIVGSSNRWAHAAALAVAENLGAGYNPLFVYGGTGLGKTHLLHAIGNLAVSNLRYLIYATAEQFTNEFVTAIRERRTEEFRSKYRGADVLLLDDVQSLAGKEQTQESFFHTFNELHNAGRQIVISSDRSPKALPLLEDRLRSRFEWGLTVDIQPPDYETRLAILQAKAETRGVYVPPDVLHYTARRIQDNIRVLEGALNRVIEYGRLTNYPLTKDLATQALAEVTSDDLRRSLTPAIVAGAVADYFHLDLSLLTGKRRDKTVALARHIAMYLIREETAVSWTTIGRELGGRDHSTVLHGYDRIASLINTDAALRRDVLEIRERLYEKDA